MHERQKLGSEVYTVEELLSAHETQIRRFINRRSGGQVLRRRTLDDLFQDTVTAAISSAHTFTYQDEKAFITWIQTIVRRVIAQAMGRQGNIPFAQRIRRRGSSGPGMNESSMDGNIRTPSSVAAEQERAKTLHDAIALLPKDYRQVLTLYKLEERSLADVARAMGRTVNATSRLYARAMAHVRKILGRP